MSLRRILILVSIALLLIALLYAAYTLLNRDSQAPTARLPEPTGELPEIPDAPPSFPNAEIPTGPTLTIGGAGGLVTVNNFYPSAAQITGTDAYIHSSLEYDIIYSRTTSAFRLQLYPTSNEEYRAYRARAEAQLLEVLQVSAEEACRLDISVEVPASYIAGSDLSVPEFAPYGQCAQPVFPATETD
jgi:hypothetical protein